MKDINSNQISEFYNDYSNTLLEKGTNIRHYNFFYEIIKAGLKKEHNILEIGCGVGIFTNLLNKYITKGKIVSTDISQENIVKAKSRFKAIEKIEFHVTDMKDFSYNCKFDFIILLDVLEHIPIEQHNNLFKILNNHTHNKSTIVINIPHPQIIEYCKKNYPERLQIIDQPIYADLLINNIYANNLVVEYYKSYALSHIEHDYILIVLKKKQEVSNYTLKSKFVIIVNKLIKRLHFLYKTI